MQCWKAANKGVVRQHLATLTVTLSVFTCANFIAWPSPIVPYLLSPASPIPVDTTQISWIISLLFLGNVFSPLPSGYLMDRVGRKTTLLVLNVLSLTSWLLILLGRTACLLYLARFLAGIWLGTVQTVVPIYLGEIAEPAIRGKLSMYYSIIGSLGSLFVYTLGPYVSYEALSLICCLSPIYFYATFIWMPESPYYLIKKDFKSAKKAMDFLRNSVDNRELLMIEASLNLKPKGTFRDLFTNANRKALFIILSMSCLEKFCGQQVISAYMSTTLPNRTFGLEPKECLIISGIVWFLSHLAMSFIVDNFGRKFLLITTSLCCGFIAAIISLWFYLDLTTDLDVSDLNWVPFIGSMLYVTIYQFGIGSLIMTLKGELMPESIKGIASAMSTIVMAVSSFLVSRSYQIITDNIGVYFNYLMFSVSAFVSCVFTIVFIFETNGKTLCEIQEIFNESANNKKDEVFKEETGAKEKYKLWL